MNFRLNHGQGKSVSLDQCPRERLESEVRPFSTLSKVTPILLHQRIMFVITPRLYFCHRTDHQPTIARPSYLSAEQRKLNSIIYAPHKIPN